MNQVTVSAARELGEVRSGDVSSTERSIARKVVAGHKGSIGVEDTGLGLPSDGLKSEGAEGVEGGDGGGLGDINTSSVGAGEIVLEVTDNSGRTINDGVRLSDGTKGVT